MADVAKSIGPIELTATPATVYTAPASTTFYMRHVRIVNNSSIAVKAYVSIGVDATPTRWLSGYSVAANDVYDWSGLDIVSTGVVIQAYAATTRQLVIYIDGIEETL